jgi:hypothetical protein
MITGNITNTKTKQTYTKGFCEKTGPNLPDFELKKSICQISLAASSK